MGYLRHFPAGLMDLASCYCRYERLVNKLTLQRPTRSGDTLRVQRITQTETQKFSSQVEIGKGWKIVEACRRNPLIVLDVPSAPALRKTTR